MTVIDNTVELVRKMQQDSNNDFLRVYNLALKAYRRVEVLEAALKEIAEETGTPYARIANEALNSK